MLQALGLFLLELISFHLNRLPNPQPFLFVSTFKYMNFNIRYCSAALAYTANNQVVLVTPKKRRDELLLPKGGLEAGLSPAGNAAKECFEEAGVRCDNEGFSLGSYDVYKRGTINRVEVFALATDGIVHLNGEGRLVRLVPIEEAIELVSPYLAPFLAKMASHLEACARHEAAKK